MSYLWPDIPSSRIDELSIMLYVVLFPFIYFWFSWLLNSNNHEQRANLKFSILKRFFINNNYLSIIYWKFTKWTFKKIFWYLNARLLMIKSAPSRSSLFMRWTLLVTGREHPWLSRERLPLTIVDRWRRQIRFFFQFSDKLAERWIILEMWNCYIYNTVLYRM